MRQRWTFACPLPTALSVPAVWRWRSLNLFAAFPTGVHGEAKNCVSGRRQWLANCKHEHPAGVATSRLRLVFVERKVFD